MKVAVVVDSRNVLGQVGAVCGVRARPTVAGVRAALARLDLEVEHVHVGLALARPQDELALARQHATNDAYRKRILAEPGGSVLLGELHVKPSGQVQEKMVDGACNVRITRYVEAINSGRSDVDMIVVMSKDIDLSPAIAYAVELDVPILVAAADVVHHRTYPFLLLPPQTLSEMSEAPGLVTGHELRELTVGVLGDRQRLRWTLTGPSSRPRLELPSGVIGVPAEGVQLPPRGQQVELYPVDVVSRSDVADHFPVVVCDTTRRRPSWGYAKMLRRTAPMTIEIAHSGKSKGGRNRVHYPMGGVVAGDTVLVHRTSGLVVGRFERGNQRGFDSNTPLVVRVVSRLPKGGAIAARDDGVRGLLTTDQKLSIGAVVPAIQIDQRPKGPVWATIGTPIAEHGEMRRGRREPPPR